VLGREAHHRAGRSIELAASLALSHLMGSQLWQVSVHDPATIACVAALLLTTGALACWLQPAAPPASSQLSRYDE